MRATLVALFPYSQPPPDDGTSREYSIECPECGTAATVNYHPLREDANKGGFYVCECCGVRGNSIALISNARGISFAEAFRWAEQGIPGYVNARPSEKSAPRARYRPQRWDDD
jgi:hypothetical protein